VDDYAAFAGAQITIADGAAFGTVTVNVVDDSLVEALEDVNAQITSADAFTTAQSNILASGSATANISDNDTPLDATLSVSVDGDETGPVAMTFRVDLSATNNTGSTLTYDLSDLGSGSATSVDDYAAFAGAQITIADGAAFGTVTVNVVDDSLVEALEDVNAQITSA
ncbi:MAG: hypothetical protein GY707_13395, partial [Desulfobacteraceae bacterium]|nr:hypothetical protein [Desulfobacteraceae bacterium]